MTHRDINKQLVACINSESNRGSMRGEERESISRTHLAPPTTRTYSPYPPETDIAPGDAPRDELGRLLPGSQLGRLGGRPPMPEELKQAVRRMAPTALEVLSSIVADEGAKKADRIRAAEVLLDRGYGKPAQSVDVSGSGIPQVVILGDVPD